MPRRLVNLALLVAVPTLVATGLLAWVAPRPIADALLVLHRVGGVAVVLALAWKYGIARRSVRRRLRGGATGLLLGGLASIALLLVLGLGLAWSIGIVSFDRPFAYSLLNVHIFAGTALLPLMVAHAARRWESRSALVDLTGRRSLLRVLAVGVGALVMTAAVDRIGVVRRSTGSRAAAADSGNDFPLTIWAFDTVPSIDVATWRITVDGEDRPLVDGIWRAELTGPHQVVATAPGFRRATFHVQVDPGRVVEIPVALQPLRKKPRAVAKLPPDDFHTIDPWRRSR